MNIGGHGLREHISLLMPLFGLITAVWALRLVLYAAGAAPFSILLRIVSVTVAGALAILLAVLMIHRRRFGAYTNVVAAVFLLIVWEELLISAAIAFAAFTGTGNAYSAPEFSFGQDAWRHIAGHLTLSIGFETIVGSGMACVLLMMLRHIDPVEGQGRAASGRKQRAVPPHPRPDPTNSTRAGAGSGPAKLSE